MRQHLEARRGALEEARHRRADQVGHEQAGRMAEVFLAPGRVGGAAAERVHDSCHGAYSSKKWVNNVLGLSLNAIGGNAFFWKQKHNILHHTYTNITHMDEDIDDKLVLKFSPHTKVKPIHKFQWLYSFLFYGITTLYWVTAKDFIQLARFNKNGVNNESKEKKRITLLRIILMKAVYFFIVLVIPTLFFGIPFIQILTGFLLMHFIAGVILTVVFQLAHSVEGTSHPLPNEEGIIENDWAIHQMNTTVNFARHSKLLSWYVGGLNFQVEHHLFPRVSHIHYPALAPIVKETAEEFGIPYLENKTFGNALKSHVQFLQRLGRLPDINEAIA